MKKSWITRFLLLIIYETNCVAAQAESVVNQRLEDIFSSSNPIESYPLPSTTAPTQCECVQHHLCNIYGEGIIDIRNNLDEDRENKTVLPKRQMKIGCGYRCPYAIVRQIADDTHGEAKFGEFPWMVGILAEEILHSQILNSYRCGGSLIHPRVVLTAAHCVSNNEKRYKIRAGEWDTQTINEILKHQDRKVQSVIIHPDYYRGTLFYDVALLILQNPVKLDQHISVACLPQQSTVIPAGTQCWATGWGTNLFEAESEYSAILRKVGLPFVESNNCQSRLRTTRLGKYFRLHESFVCAGGIAGKDVCQGYGGGPLVCPISGQADRYQQVGIVAWGIGCGGNGIPGVYGNVALFRKWIDTEVSKHNLDITQYQY